MNLSFAEVAPEQVRQAMLAQGLPEEIPDRLLCSLADYARQPGPTNDTVRELLGRPALTFPYAARAGAPPDTSRELLGRPALTFAEWAAENAAAFTSR